MLAFLFWLESLEKMLEINLKIFLSYACDFFNIVALKRVVGIRKPSLSPGLFTGGIGRKLTLESRN